MRSEKTRMSIYEVLRIMTVVTLSATIVFLFAFCNSEKVKVLANENSLIYIPSNDDLENIQNNIPIATNAEGGINILVEGDITFFSMYSISNGTTVLKTSGGENNKIKIETPEIANNVTVTVEAGLFKQNSVGNIDIILNGASVLNSKFDLWETSAKTDSFAKITAKAQSGGELYIWASTRIYVKSITVSCSSSVQELVEKPIFMESYELYEDGILPNVVSEVEGKNGVYRFIGWVNEENKAVDHTNTLPKGKYKTVYVAIKSRLAKILISTPTSICFGYYVYFLNEDIAGELIGNGSVKFEGILSPENTSKVTKRMLDQYVVSGNAVEIDIAIHSIPKEYYKTNIETDLAVYFNNELAIETTDKCTRSIAYVAEAALYDTKDVEEGEYLYKVYIDGKLRYSRYTVTQRNTLSELCGVFL